MGQRANRGGHPPVEGGGSDVPVLPAVITANEYVIPAGVRPCQSNRARSGIGAIFSKSHHLGAWHHLDDFFRNQDLNRMRERKYHPVSELFSYCFGNVRVVIAQSNCGEAVDEVDIFVTVDIPYTASLSAREKQWRNPAGILGDAFAEGLRTKGDRL